MKKLKKNLQNNKKSLILSGIIVIAIIGCSVVLINFKFSKASIDTSRLLENQTVENIEFLNASINNNNLKVVVHNNEATTYNLKTIDVIFKDSNGNKIESINTFIGNDLDGNEYKQLSVDTDADLSNAYSIQYRINK